MRTWPSVLLFCGLAAAGDPTAALACGSASLEIGRAFDSLYNFDFPATHAGLDTYIGMHPREPLPYAVRASAYLFYELDRLGILESEFLISDRRIAEKTGLRPDPLLREKLLGAIKEAQTLSDEVLATNPNDREALLSMCIVLGVATDYMALVEKHQIRSLSPAKRSVQYAQRLLKMNPPCYDAYLTTGLTEYMVASLPFFIRWFVRFDQVQGSKDRAKQNLETVAWQVGLGNRAPGSSSLAMRRPARLQSRVLSG